MDRYINFSDLWKVLKGVEYEGEDTDLALQNLINLLKLAHGSYDIRDNQLIFIEHYNYLDYKYSSSVIGSDDEKLRVEQKEKLLFKIESERSVILWMLNKLNDCFYDHDEVYLEVFYDRYFLNCDVRHIFEKYRINRKKYYRIMENAEYLAKRAWLLVEPKKDMLEML